MCKSALCETPYKRGETPLNRKFSSLPIIRVLYFMDLVVFSEESCSTISKQFGNYFAVYYYQNACRVTDIHLKTVKQLKHFADNTLRTNLVDLTLFFNTSANN